jgi:CheY-like chemotaxis protein/anti-sigma regulatory factor (Ser/Thr protein kinase)
VPPQVTGDEDRLAQILKNLVMNAIQYTEKGDITLSITPLHQTETSVRLLFAVSDTGLGLPAEEQEDIFTSPPLGETTRSGDFPRSGLGLTIARQLAELMNGTIEAASEQGKGSTFRFEAEFGKLADTKETDQQEPVLNLEDLPSLTFLLAEDSRVNRVFLYRALTRAGHRVILAEDGRDAIDALNTEHVDCIIMDIQMPEVNGLEAPRRIRRGESGKNSPDVPILALTAYAMKGDSERFLAAGMDGYLSKPVNFLDLARAIQNVIKADR